MRLGGGLGGGLGELLLSSVVKVYQIFIIQSGSV